MLLMKSNYENNETLNFQGLNYSKVILAFLDQGKLLTVANEMIFLKITPVKMSKKGHNRYPEKSDYLKKKILKEIFLKYI